MIKVMITDETPADESILNEDKEESNEKEPDETVLEMSDGE